GRTFPPLPRPTGRRAGGRAAGSGAGASHARRRAAGRWARSATAAAPGPTGLATVGRAGASRLRPPAASAGLVLLRRGGDVLELQPQRREDAERHGQGRGAT